MRSLIIEARTAGPIVDQDDPLHLDGIISLADTLRHRSRPIDRQSKRADLREQHLPFARISWGGAWIWLCSAAEVISPDAPAAVRQTKRRDAEDMARLDRPINTHAGPDKDVLLRRQARVSAGLRWYARGSRAGARRALKLLWGPEDAASGFLGSARRSGAGQIVSWSIVDADHDPERCVVLDGCAVRHIPAAWVERADAWTTGAVAPPYWLPDGQADVPRIGSPVVLRPEALQAIASAGRAPR